MQTFKLRWAGDPEALFIKGYGWSSDRYQDKEALLLRQAKRMKRVNTTLARQGFVLSDTDPEGFLIYVQAPKRGHAGCACDLCELARSIELNLEGVAYER